MLLIIPKSCTCTCNTNIIDYCQWHHSCRIVSASYFTGIKSTLAGVWTMASFPPYTDIVQAVHFSHASHCGCMLYDKIPLTNLYNDL